MPINPPVLDSRRFDDLVAEARQRIPRYTPEWTNFNDSDPGMTLVKLHAWLAETILYELNRVPDLSYVAFLNLIGVEPRPARPARAELAFTLDALDKPQDPLTVNLPRGVRAAVADPALPTEMLFETDAPATALNAAVGAVIAQGAGADRALVTLFPEDAVAPVWLHAFTPFGPNPATEATLHIGLLLRPKLAQTPDRYLLDRLPAGPLDLYVDVVDVGDADPEGARVDGPLTYESPGAAGLAPRAGIEWQIFAGLPDAADAFLDPAGPGGWTRITASSDETFGLTRSGHVVLEIPPSAGPLAPDVLPRDFWASFDQKKPPTTPGDLLAALADPDLDILGAMTEDDWTAMGLEGELLEDVLACGEDAADVLGVLGTAEGLRPDRVGAARWAEIDPAFAIALPAAGGALRPLYWLRAILKEPAEQLVALREIRLNSVPATQAATRLDERLGASDGRPAQRFTLQKTPVLIDLATGAPDIEIEVAAEAGSGPWSRVESFFAAGPEAQVYVVDPGAGTVSFGDGRNGAIPIAGAAVVARRYRHGGGAAGNVAAGAVSALKGRIAGVKSVSNPRPANGGADAETPEATRMRAPSELRARDRAVTAEDFADLARGAPGVAVHRAHAVAGRRPVLLAQGPDAYALSPQDGAVTVVLLPARDEPRPQPRQAELRAVAAHLDARRLVTTELHVVGPLYAEIARLEATLSVDPAQEIRVVMEAATAALLRRLHPVTGGADGRGWPYGEDIFHADLYRLLLETPGVRRVSGLSLTLAGADADPLPDVTALPEGRLPYLPRSAIALTPRHD